MLDQTGGQQPDENAESTGFIPDYPYVGNLRNFSEVTTELGTWFIDYYNNYASSHVFNNQPGISYSIYNQNRLISDTLREERSELMNALNQLNGYSDLISLHPNTVILFTENEIIGRINAINEELFELHSKSLDANNLVFQITGEQVHPRCSLTLGPLRFDVENLLEKLNSQSSSFSFTYSYETNTSNVVSQLTDHPVNIYYRFQIYIQKT